MMTSSAGQSPASSRKNKKTLLAPRPEGTNFKRIVENKQEHNYCILHVLHQLHSGQGGFALTIVYARLISLALLLTAVDD
jgi:hypothetical protein